MSKKLLLLFPIGILLLFGLFVGFDIYNDTFGLANDFLASVKAGGGGHHSKSPHFLLVIPFVMLLSMIATGPLFYEHWWHKNYPITSVVLAAIVILVYIFFLHNVHAPVHAIAEYVQFIALVGSLYVASGGILIEIDRKGTPAINICILVVGAVISNLIGTTGASMLLIRPFMRLNKHHIKAYHVVFFIFVVSNIGGSLTPIGDPPLFLGFLKGVPFEWSITHNFIPWVFGIVVLCVIFYIFEKRNLKKPASTTYNYTNQSPSDYTNKIKLIGAKNFLWLVIIIVAVFIDPNVFDWVPGINYDGQKFSFIRELIMITVAVCSFKFADKRAINGNEFNFEPIKEVAFVFIGIFGTMMPALELVANFAKSPEGAALISEHTLYWGTGILSGFLDNAPTYLNFLTAAIAAQEGNIGVASEVAAFATGEGGFVDSVVQLTAISVAAVFFGAMTYIGNGPNFMVKSIAEQTGLMMPTFFGYLIRFSLPILLPVLIVVWLLFI